MKMHRAGEDIDEKQWRERLRIVREAYKEYVAGMKALRKRVILRMRRKLDEHKALKPGAH